MSAGTEVRKVLGLAADAPTSAVVAAIRESRETVAAAAAEEVAELAQFDTGSEFDSLDPVSASAHLAAVRVLGRPAKSEGEYLQALRDSGYGTEAA